MNITIPVYQRKLSGGMLEWRTIGLGEFSRVQTGRSGVKIQQQLVEQLKAVTSQLEPRELSPFEMSRGIDIERVYLELTLKGESRRKIAGRYPVVVEPRWFNADTRVEIAYHPLRQDEWVPLQLGRGIEEQVGLYFSRTWAGLSKEQLDELKTDGKDRIKTFAFTARPKSLLDRARSRKKGLWDDLEDDKLHKSKPKKDAVDVLRTLGTDKTVRAADKALATGSPRSPYRQQLQLLLSGKRKRSVLLIGEPGVGKTTLIHQWIADLLDADDYVSHRNLDRVHHVWTIAGKRIIAGMTYLGDWEKRCIALLEEVGRKRVVLHVEDVFAWGRLGRTRSSDRNLAEFFRGPVARGDLVIVGEATPAELQRLEEDAPSFAALLSPIVVHPTTASETLSLMVAAARELESSNHIRFEPFVHRTVLELGGALLANAEQPGKALTLLAELGRYANSHNHKAVTPQHVIELLSARTGLPTDLLTPSEPLTHEDLVASFGRHVMGQPAAATVAADLVLRIRGGLTDPRRPYATLLFTGPTGTGKTELAKCIAEYLFGDTDRLVRFDMSEYSGPDAPGRLIGDRYDPDGLLTRAVREQPFAVVLLDEIEKAHASVFNLLLQLFEDGRLTDAAGRTSDFSHTVVIMTSNLGARRQAPVGFSEAANAVNLDIAKAIRDFFAPELFNRIDQVVPFSLLSPEAARRIADKELRKLLARRGLAERNIVVYASETVLDRIVGEGFDPVYGARTVKRYLEDHVGLLLSDQIAGGPRAQLSIFHLYDRGDEIGLHVEPLTEASARDEEWTVRDLLDLPPDELRQRLPAALDQLEELVTDELLDSLGEKIGDLVSSDLDEETAEAAFTLDTLRSSLKQLRGKTAWLLSSTSYDRGAMLEALAELHFMRRAMDNVADPSQHTIFIELLDMGRGVAKQRFGKGVRRLMDELILGFAEGRGEVVEAVAAANEHSGPIVCGRPEFLTTDRPELCVLELHGLGLFDYYEGETGCHIWDSQAGGTQIVRVRVLPDAPDRSAFGLVETHRRQLAAFEVALEGRAPLPDNPRRLLPAVRHLTFERPTRRGDYAEVEVEDYVTGHLERARVRHLREVLPRLWMVRASRESFGPTSEPAEEEDS